MEFSMTNTNFIGNFKPKKPYELRVIDNQIKKTRKELDKPRNQNSFEGDALLDELDKLVEEYKEREKTLNLTSIFGDTKVSADVTCFKGAKIGFSLGDLCKRININKETKFVYADKYNVTGCAPEFDYETSIPDKNGLNDLTVLRTDLSDRITFGNILAVPSSMAVDLELTVSAAFDHIHKKHIINAENKKALTIMRDAKPEVTMSPPNLQSIINENLCGKAKENAYIITNKSGFAKLDVDVNGIPQVTKDDHGNMVYKHKYIIKEVPDEILENSENGSPCIIGDIADVLNFYVIDDSGSEMDDWTEHKDRRIVREIIALATTSDEAYIHGVLA